MTGCLFIKSVYCMTILTKCSDSLASLTRSLVGRASDLQAEGRGFEAYTGKIFFLPMFTSMATRKSGLRLLEGSIDPRACRCRGVMPRSRQFLSTTVYHFKD